MTMFGDMPRATSLLLALMGASALAFLAVLLPASVPVATKDGPPSPDLQPMRLHAFSMPQPAPYDAIAEHSIFNTDHAKDQPPPPPKPPPPPPLENYELVGVVVSMSNHFALVERKADQQVMRLRSGDTFDGWTVGLVGPGAVQVSGGGQAGTLSIPRAAGRVTMHGITTFMSSQQGFVQ